MTIGQDATTKGLSEINIFFLSVVNIWMKSKGAGAGITAK